MQRRRSSRKRKCGRKTRSLEEEVCPSIRRSSRKGRFGRKRRYSRKRRNGRKKKEKIWQEGEICRKRRSMAGGGCLAGQN